MTNRVDLGDVQSGVLRSYPSEFRCTRYVFLELTQPARTDSVEAARRVLANWLARVSFGQPPERSGAVGAGRNAGSETTDEARSNADPQLNVAFTFQGLETLGVPEDLLAALPRAFREGARKRARRLGDDWHQQRGRGPIPVHEAQLMLAIHSRSREDGARRWQSLDLINRRTHQPFRVLHMLDAAFPESNQRERFGFADGRSQPAVQGVDIDAVGGGAYARVQATDRRSGRRVKLEDLGLRPVSRGWRLIRTGEFLLGYENEDGDLPSGSAAPLGPNSTFMVYREIDQHVRTFKRYVQECAKRTGLSEDQIRAKIVGRWQDGTPAVRLHRDPTGLPGNRRRSNDFLYEQDSSGYACPLGAHVRRANPRDALPGGGEQTLRHRIIRRGMPYESVTDTFGSRRQGLAFVCFNAGIENGFEFIQRHWINDGEAFGLGSQRDFLLQQPNRRGTKMVIQGYRPTVLEPPEQPFVTVRGCEYLFVPSRTACTWLAGLPLRL